MDSSKGGDKNVPSRYMPVENDATAKLVVKVILMEVRSLPKAAKD